MGHHLGKFGGGGQSVVSDREAGLKPLLLAQRLLTHPLTTLLKAATKTTFFSFLELPTILVTTWTNGL